VRVSNRIVHRFVEEIPREVEVGVVYVSILYATAVHRCPGCDRKVATPFAPGSWRLIFDGDTISISPSIANIAHACNSHYWITSNRIVWALPVRRRDRGISEPTRVNQASPELDGRRRYHRLQSW